MVSQVQNQKSNLDYLCWGIAFILITASVVGNYYFSSYSVLLRALLLVIITGLSLLVVARTTVGKKARVYWQETVLEFRKVVWPTKDETLRSTIAVLSMVAIMSLLLWAIDAVLIKVVAKIIGHGGV